MIEVDKAEPMPDWHVCRIADPADFEADSFRALDQKDGKNRKAVEIIVGKLKPGDDGDGKTSTASIRYHEGTWTADEARQHCRANHKGAKFTPAKELSHEEQAHRGPYRSFRPDAEFRVLQLADLEIRADEGRQKIVGYAAVFGSESEDLGGFRELIEPGAFRSLLASQDDVPATMEHDPARILGRRSAGTLQLTEDRRGLRFEVTPPNTTYANDLLESMRRGDIKGASFGYLRRDASAEWRSSNGNRIHAIREIRSLIDVSIVSTPAYSQASASLRHLAADPYGVKTPVVDNFLQRARLRLRLMQSGLRIFRQ